MKQQKQQKEYGKKFFVPILLILAVLPLITNAHIYDNGSVSYTHLTLPTNSRV